MTPTKEQLEALAFKHSDENAITFTLSQLDAYFNERLRLTMGEPAAWEAKDSCLLHEDDRLTELIGWTPLYKLEILK